MKEEAACFLTVTRLRCRKANNSNLVFLTDDIVLQASYRHRFCESHSSFRIRDVMVSTPRGLSGLSRSVSASAGSFSPQAFFGG